MTRVAIDARRLQDSPMTGVGRGLRNVIAHLPPDIDIVLLTDGSRPPVEGCWAQKRLFGWGGLPEPLWLQFSVAYWLRRFDGVFHGTYNGLPAGYRGPAVVSVYDLSFDHHPEDFSPGRRIVFSATARLSIRQAQVVLVPSEFVRRSVVETHRVEPDRVQLAAEGPDPIFSPGRAPTGRALVTARGFGPRYVVAIGGARRRGLETAVAAWQQLAPEHRPDLVVVGHEAPPPHPGICHLGRIDDPSWAAVLAGAEALLYPTRYEGYGMPAIEAAACGVPVVCARVGPLPEVLGDAAEWSTSTTAPDMATALRRVIGDPDRRAELRRRGLEKVASSPSWADIARVTADAYRRAYRERRR